MIIDQDHKCKICRSILDLGKHTHVDHCHTTRRVRGVLCNLCNTAIGKFQDDPVLLRRAAVYLEEN